MLPACEIKWCQPILIRDYHLWFLPSRILLEKKKKKKNFVLPCRLLRSDFLPQVHSHSDRPCCSQMELQRSLPKDNFHFKAQTWKALPCWVNEPTVFLLSQALLKGSWRKKLAEELGREEVENKTWVAFFLSTSVFQLSSTWLSEWTIFF